MFAAFIFLIQIFYTIHADEIEKIHLENHAKHVLEANGGLVYSDSHSTPVLGIEYEFLRNNYGFAIAYEYEKTGGCAHTKGADIYVASFLYRKNDIRYVSGFGQAHLICKDSSLVRLGIGYEINNLNMSENMVLVPSIFADYVFNQLELTFSIGLGYHF